MRSQPLVGASGVNSVCFQGGESKLGNRASCHSVGNNKNQFSLISFGLLKNWLNIWRATFHMGME